jgi:hypothetical protein
MQEQLSSEPIQEEKPKGGIVAAYIGASVAIVSIGVFHLIGHANGGFKEFLKLHDGIGPLSGKVLFAHLLGFAVFAVAYALLKNKREANFIVWTIVLIIALLLGTLFTYTPFVELVA